MMVSKQDGIIIFKKCIVVFLLIGLHAVLLWNSAKQKSPTVDEGSHLAAGLFSLSTGDFRLNREAAPLQNIVCATIPTLLYNYTLPFDNECWKKGIWNGSGARLLEANPDNFFSLLLAARIGSIFLSALLCLVVFLWSLELWGYLPAIFVLFITVLEPNIIAHGRLVTTDTGATLMFVLTGYLFWRFTRKPNWFRLIALGMSFGLCWYAKHSAFLFLLILPVGFGLWAWSISGQKAGFLSKWMKSNRLRRTLVASILLTAICVSIGLFVIWAGYGFEVGDSISWDIPATMSPLWAYSRVYVMPIIYLFHWQDKFILTGDENDPLHEFFRHWLPAYSHWSGFAKNQLHLEQGHVGYFMGHFSGRGWISYYPVLFLIKTPFPLLIILFWGLGFLLLRKISMDRLSLFALAGIPVIYALVLMFFNTANIGYRHALPVVPFFLILFGGAFFFRISRLIHLYRFKHFFLKQTVGYGLMSIILLSWLSIEMGMIYPHYLSYFSSVVGGWKQGPRYAIDSNLDWGQDLFFLKKFMKDRNLNSVKLAYFGPKIYPGYFGIPHEDAFKLSKLVPGDYVISVTTLSGLCSDPFDKVLPQFQPRKPDAYVAPSLYYYHIAE